MKKSKRSFSSNINSLNNNNKKEKENINYNIDKNCLLHIKAQIINSKLMHGTGYNGDYVEYWIEVITDYKKWIIKKRYSEFYELNKKIMLKIPEINKLFPPKRFFKNSEDTIDERKTCFNKYLRFLFKEKNIFSFNEVLDFIQIDKKIVELYDPILLEIYGEELYNFIKSFHHSFAYSIIYHLAAFHMPCGKTFISDEVHKYYRYNKFNTLDEDLEYERKVALEKSLDSMRFYNKKKNTK